MLKQHTALLVGALVVGAVALWAGAPFGGVLFVGLVVLCPLMMLLMMILVMRGMGHGSDRHPDPGQTPSRGQWSPGQSASSGHDQVTGGRE